MKDVYKGILISVAIVVPIIYLLERKKRDLTTGGKKGGNVNLIVGDSHAVGIGSKISGVIVDKKIATGGWTLSDLTNALNSYPQREDVGKVFISIGTNGLYRSSDNIENLVNLLNQKFPNATLYAYKGSYGWSGSLTKSVLEQRQTDYYNRMRNSGVIILSNGLGYFTDGGQAHTTSTPQAKAIITEINNIIK